jgi:16S rRNA (adenine1518-N6/adenine1519-N6)-dimethyltransferase
LDDRLSNYLQNAFIHDYPQYAKSLRVINADATKLAPEDLVAQGSDLAAQYSNLAAQCPDFATQPTKLVSNLPYNIASSLLLTLLERFESIQEAVIMVQKEVAERLCAKSGSKTYGAVTAKLSLYGEAKGLKVVSGNVFYPMPNVESEIIRFVRTSRFLKQYRQRTFELIDLAFSERRKMIKSAFFKFDYFANILLFHGISPSLRAENLEAEDYYNIAKCESESVSVKVPAKLNLYLKVLGKSTSKDAKHIIETVFHAVLENTGETISIFPSNDFSIGVTSPFYKHLDALLPAEKNICNTAADLFCKAAKVQKKFFIAVNKKTPIMGGMAGGSGDAAGTLSALNTFFENPLTPKELYSIAEELGADVPFLLELCQEIHHAEVKNTLSEAKSKRKKAKNRTCTQQTCTRQRSAGDMAMCWSLFQ